MGICVLRATGRLLAPVVAVALLAGVSLEATAGSKGTIRLVTSNESGYAAFEFTDASGTLTQTQRFFTPAKTKCIVAEDGWVNTPAATPPGSPSLVDVKAFKTGDLNDTAPVGLLNASIGVYDNSKGTSCSRMTDALGEGLILRSKKGAFDRIELDLEAKGSAVFEVVIDPKAGATPSKIYRLFTGVNIGYAGTNCPAGVTACVDATCNGGSDSGPDSNLNDNCPWDIKAVGESFSLRPIRGPWSSNGVNGEGSLEGGGDYVTALAFGDNTTKIHLTSLVDIGTLGCTSANNKTARVFSDDPTAPAAACSVSRINYDGVLGTSNEFCTGPIAYRLETFTTETMCQLDKTGGVDDQLAGMLDVTFTKEDRTPLEAVGLTWIKFRKPDGTETGPFYPDLCAPQRVDDPNGTGATFTQVLNGTLPGYKDVGGNFVYATSAPSGFSLTTLFDGGSGNEATNPGTDQVPNNDYVDWACILESKVEVVEGSLVQQVTQKILFWGDISFSRTGPGN